MNGCTNCALCQLSHSPAAGRTPRTWLPWCMAVVTIAEPRPVVTLTEMPPMRLHTEMYHIMFLSPYLRALSLARGS
jgi:hypothetical protein